MRKPPTHQPASLIPATHTVAALVCLLTRVASTRCFGAIWKGAIFEFSGLAASLEILDLSAALAFLVLVAETWSNLRLLVALSSGEQAGGSFG